MRLRSLQLRLTVRLALVYLLAIAMAVSFFIYQAYDAAGSLSDRQLGLRAADLARYVSVDKSGAPRLDLPPELAAAYAAASDADPFAFVRSGSIHPMLPSGRRYTTDNPSCAAFLNTIV